MKFYLKFTSINDQTYIPIKYYHYTGQLSPSENQFINFIKPNIRIICQECHKDISNSLSVLVIIKNQKHSQNDFCVMCFYQLLMQDNNKLEGVYHVRTKNNYSFSDSQWTITNQILFLKALLKFGYGNWNEIFHYLTLHKCLISKSSYKIHLRELFLLEEQSFSGGVDYFIKPCQSHVEWDLEKWVRNSIKITNNQINKSSSKIHQSILNQSIVQQRQIVNCTFKTNNCSETTYESHEPFYRKQRQEFLVQDQPYAESVIAYLQFRESDTNEQISFKDKILIEYNKKLLERKNKKKYVIQRNLFGEFDKDYNRIQEIKNDDVLFEPFSLKNQFESQIKSMTLLYFDRFFENSEERNHCEQKIKQHENSLTLINTLKYIKQQNPKLKSLKQVRNFLNQNKISSKANTSQRFIYLKRQKKKIGNNEMKQKLQVIREFIQNTDSTQSNKFYIKIE